MNCVFRLVFEQMWLLYLYQNSRLYRHPSYLKFVSYQHFLSRSEILCPPPRQTELIAYSVLLCLSRGFGAWTMILAPETSNGFHILCKSSCYQHFWLCTIHVYDKFVEILLLNCPNIYNKNWADVQTDWKTSSDHQWCAFVTVRHRLHYSYNQLAPCSVMLLLPTCRRSMQLCSSSATSVSACHTSRAPWKGRSRAKDISQAVLYMWSSQQLIITTEANWTQLSVARALDQLCRIVIKLPRCTSAFCRCRQCLYCNTTLLRKVHEVHAYCNNSKRFQLACR